MPTVYDTSNIAIAKKIVKGKSVHYNSPMNLEKDLTSFIKSAKKPLVVLLGPTASGKTELSLNIASKSNGEIISADSRQIYKGMEIATDTIPEDERRGIPHHMLGIADPDEEFTLADYKKIAFQTIEEIQKRGRTPILVGGTGLYVSAIIEGYDINKIPPNKELRDKLENEAKKRGKEVVHEKLKKLDPEAAKKIHPNNLRYVIRAIEKISATGDKKRETKKTPLFDLFLIGIERPREEIYEKINKRVDEQIEKGLVDEVKKLVKKGYGENLPSMSSLGVKEIVPYIKGEMSLEECSEILKKNTRNYAKRQLTWWRTRQIAQKVNVVTSENLP